MSVSIERKKVIIPTYEPFAYDKNPMFLERRVYQGSCGKVYPHPVCEGIEDVKKDKEYDAIILENDYILVMILPELGGRIQRLYDKTNGYDAVYYNEVVKPALVGLAGPWISGGIEFNWPQHHRPSTFDPVDCTITQNADGSVTVTCGETEKMFQTKGNASFTVYPDRAYLKIDGRVYNPTEEDRTFLWWANPAVSVNDYTRSIFPPDVTAVYDHGKRDVSQFPIAKGVYYKVNYAPGTDISRYRNIPVPTSYMAHHSDYDFIGNYDDSKAAGLLHVASHHVSPGKKQWTWGNGDFGRAWDRNLTDENGPYIELMTGVFTDNQPDFTYLKPYEEKTFTQYFMPYKDLGAIKNANTEYAINLEVEGNEASIKVYSSSNHSENAEVMLTNNNKEYFRKDILLNATETFETKVKVDSEEGLKLALITNKGEILSYTNKKVEADVPKAKDPMPEPKDVATNEELFLNGIHLEQYRHATFRPEDYYLEGLKRDPSDLRINTAYGKLLYHRGYFKESVKYFEAAIKKATMHNPNPYDCECFYGLGLALAKLGDDENAFAKFYKATWDGNMAAKAFYELGKLSCKKGELEEALKFFERALIFNQRNNRARGLKCAVERILGKVTNTVNEAKETLSFDSLDYMAYFELFKAGEISREEATKAMRGDNADIIELAIPYIEAGLKNDALDVFSLAFNSDEPMINYYMFYVTGNKNFLEKAEKASSLYCFPNRLFDIVVLEKAINEGGKMAAYYLGLLLYDKGNSERAISLWESLGEDSPFPTVHRNLSIAYYNKKHDYEASRARMEKAFALDESDVRVFYELTELYRSLELDKTFRLNFMRSHEQMLDKRDPLYTAFITLLNDHELYREAYDRIMSHKFHPWEGGEGKITREYKRALIGLSEAESDEDAVKLLQKALYYPENLGEGKLIGELDNDIYYYLAVRTKGDERKKYLELSARGELNLSSAMYYNDQPPEMMYYRALSLNLMGKREEAVDIFERMVQYGTGHINDEMKFDFFAVSLPDFLIFEADLNKKNKAHCENMINLGNMGLKAVNER